MDTKRLNEFRRQKKERPYQQYSSSIIDIYLRSVLALFRSRRLIKYEAMNKNRIPNPLSSDLFWIIILAIVFLLFIALFLLGLVVNSEAVMGLMSFQKMF
jgi:hypothetical protein